MYTAYDSFHGNSFGLTLSTRALSKPWAQLKPIARIFSRPVVRDVDIQMAYLPLTHHSSKNIKPSARVAFHSEKTNQEIIEGLFDFYVINLDRDHKRLARFTEMMQSHSVGFHRVEAIDGYNLNTKKLQKDGVVTPRAASVLHRGEIAVALSQKSVWQDNILNKKPFIVVFEDDVRVPEDFSTKLTQLVGYIRDYDFDVLFLGRTTWAQKLCQNQFGWEHHGCVNTPSPAKLPGPIIDAPFSWGAFAYVASTKSLPKLVSAYQVIDRPIDAQWWLPEYQLKMATTNPLWMDQYSTDLYDSHSYGTL
jgi:aspartate 1-decarboxylase